MIQLLRVVTKPRQLNAASLFCEYLPIALEHVVLQVAQPPQQWPMLAYVVLQVHLD